MEFINTVSSYGVSDTVEALESRWDHLTIANDFVFCKAMSNPELCREVLEAILGVEIERIEYTRSQETLDVTPESKSVRLDVYVRDGRGTTYDVEMQATDTRELPQRARYYHSLMAVDQLRRGEDYRKLKESYAIFICGFDPFKRGLRVYSFRNRCDADSDVTLGDGTRTVFLAAPVAGPSDASDPVNELLDYVAGRKVTGALSARLDAEVRRVLDNKKWRLEYVILQMRDQLNYERGHDEGHELGVLEGREQGLAEGRELGLAEGREAGLAEGRRDALAKLDELLKRLAADGSSVTVQQLLADEALMDELCERYGI